MVLTPIELRVLGSLMEKESSTPEYYPLTLNSLTAACNQKSSREPVMQVEEHAVRDALRSLESTGLVRVDRGGRAERYEHLARSAFQLRRDEAALLCLLFLRGEQTAGELRSRADRLFSFDDTAAVHAALVRMGSSPPSNDGRPAREPLVAAVERRPGEKEQRFRHLFTAGPSVSAERVQEEPRSTLEERVHKLELAVAELNRLLQTPQR